MIKRMNKLFVLSTLNTTYCFSVLPSGHLEHLYYGDKLTIEYEEDADALKQKVAFIPGNANCYDEAFPKVALEDLCLEMSSYGKGDLRESFIDIEYADGSTTSDFIFKEAIIREEKQPLHSLPSSYGSQIPELIVTLKDRNSDIELDLHYATFEHTNIISRWSVVRNTSNEQIKLKRLMSNQVDFCEENFIFTSFNGAWAREMERKDTLLTSGKLINSSITGGTSSRANSFVMLSQRDACEQYGSVYGFNLIYSGNHYEVAETSTYEQTRFVSGINPQFFTFVLAPGDRFESPEAVMSYTSKGFTQLSLNFHTFIRNHIIRGEWKDKERPIVLNSWEASYFDISEAKLLKLAKSAADVGIELFVMDDGWFGTRNDDKQALGDWYPNLKKLPHGVTGICKKITALGMKFGIWVEPEMINVKSKLYEAHPEWVIEIPNKPHAEGRNQRILDFANPEVVSYITNKMKELFSSAQISYVKWDMNRIFSDYFSQYLLPNRQGELAHRYIIGLYNVMNELTQTFSHILFEGCASGGNRFDLGTLCYFPQIWASDNTDALYRVQSQTNYSYGYPMSVLTSHVSAIPNHQTLRHIPLTTRFNVAAFGVFGYEINLSELSGEEIKEVKAEIEIYKKWRRVLQYGTFYRGRNDNIHEWCVVSEDKKLAVGLLMQEQHNANKGFHQFFAKGLDRHTRYRFTNRALKYNIKQFGGLVNMVSPIHIRQDSLLHNLVANFVKMPGETEEFIASGELLMKAGIKLQQAFSSTGYDENTRLFLDYGSRMYFLEAMST